MRKIMMLLISLLLLSGCKVEKKAKSPADDVPPLHIQQVDLDNDGETELVIENEYLKIVALLPQTKGEDKYATRFVWGGWITDLIFKPTNLNHLVGEYFKQGDIDWTHRHYLGLPDQFEKTVTIEEGDQARKELLIGVGILARRKLPDGKWSKTELERTAPWTVEIEDRPDGVKALRFTQKLSTDYGYAYELTRSIVVAPGRSTFRIGTALRNTGAKAIDTDWYLHPFFAFGGYKGECWQEIPLAVGKDKPARVEAFAMPLMEETGTVWGWLTPPELGGRNWFATGTRDRDLFFAASWDFPLLRVRNWLSGHTYAIEPFTKVNLAPGKESTWGMDIVVGAGMWRAADVNPHGALDIRTADSGKCEIAFMPTQARRNGIAHVRVMDKNGAEMAKQDLTLPPCTPDKPGRVLLNLPSPNVHVSAAILVDGKKLIGADRAIQAGDPVRSEPAQHLRGKSALLVADGKDRTRQNELLYLSAVLRREGMEVAEACPSELPAELKKYDVVVALSAQGLPVDRMEAYVRSGGALFATPPFDEPLLKVLPSEGKPELVEMAEWPEMPRQSGDPRAEDIPALRVHLTSKGDHPITKGLPFYPNTVQSIARFYRVREKAGAEVPVRYSNGDSPALILSPKEKVAVFMSPVMWGQPAHWVLWGTFSEYHRELMTRIVEWCCRK